MSNLRVLFVTPEAYPVMKTGGLGDVSGALPSALHQAGVDARLLLPGYPAVLQQTHSEDTGIHLALFPGINALLRLGTMPDSHLPVYVLDCPGLYQREGNPYTDANGQDWPDNALRFAALSKAAALMGTEGIRDQIGFIPQIIHCNDWQTGLTPAYQRYLPGEHPHIIMSIHNMAYQGLFPADMLTTLDLPEDSLHVYGLEYYGQISFLKAGLYYADWVTTVSPTYAEEIQGPEFGYGMEGLLGSRQKQLTGLINGIDYQQWNPATDNYLWETYDADSLDKKASNTRALRQQLKLNESDQPLIGIVTRLTHQKGIDMVIAALPDIIHEGAQFAILGSGDLALEKLLAGLADRYPGQVSFTQGYHEALSHQIEAGADMFLMPSRFEPCGLNQLYSMAYGTIPIVRHTGGLADTVIPVTPTTLDTGTATGFLFDEESPQALFDCVDNALVTYRNPDLWRQLQINGMKRDFSWHRSAQSYIELYRLFTEE
ncbi:glycogen synthase GlgA [Candidatus Venteria ishoeyi]|uniref:Glycogen synthase n=1 Tax=Candidatus Venteria ishoeyi TaxID=1899563 RepID=A0A1H6F8U3_9GAMM|nr:glycogen synthase GlgA [Candidatus Venteria ishoeyi]SEH06547.1 Glycogen synthase [Candidatus Venteria ishoeyi]